MTENERIAQVRKKKNLTMEKFGSLIGITKGAVSLIESGKNSISNTTRRAICREFGVSEEWLRDGIGGDEVVFTRTTDDFAASFAQKHGLDDVEEVILSEYIKLDTKEREAFRKFLKNVLRDLNGTSESDLARKKSLEEMTIDEKVASYRAELEAEEAARRSSTLPTGNAEGA